MMNASPAALIHAAAPRSAELACPMCVALRAVALGGGEPPEPDSSTAGVCVIDGSDVRLFDSQLRPLPLLDMACAHPD